MHRSGTSLLTSLLFSITNTTRDKKHFVEADEGNPRGYFEEKKVVKINNQIIKLMGGNSWSVFQPKKLSQSDILQIDSLILSYLNEEGHNDLTILKDPRFCITLQFWIKHISNYSIIFNWRNPIEVCYSLQKRGDSISTAEGLDLWFFYNDIFVQKYGLVNNIKFFNYEDFFTNPSQILENIVKLAGIPFTKEIFKKYFATIDPELKSRKIEDYHYEENIIAILSQLEKLTLKDTTHPAEFTFDIEEVRLILKNFSIKNTHQLAELRKNYLELYKINNTITSQNKKNYQLIEYLKLLLKAEKSTEDYYQRLLTETFSVQQALESELNRVSAMLNNIQNSFTVRNAFRFRRMLFKIPFIKSTTRLFRSLLIFLKKRING